MIIFGPRRSLAAETKARKAAYAGGGDGERVGRRRPSISSLRFPSPKRGCAAQVEAPVSFFTKASFRPTCYISLMSSSSSHPPVTVAQVKKCSRGVRGFALLVGSHTLELSDYGQVT